MSSIRARAIPLTAIGYVVAIMSFALLGFFTYNLATGSSSSTWIFGVGAAIGFIAVIMIFRTVVRQEHDTTEEEDILVNVNPLIPSEHRSHLAEYLDHVPPRSGTRPD